jgi:Holliday junction DNA helicase RuvA
MIAFLEGIIERITDRMLVVNVQGVGYAVHVPMPVLTDAKIGDTAKLHIHTSVTESDIILYGFPTVSECVFFEHLISVAGIGARTGLQIMAQPVALITQSIIANDIPTLVKLPGIGKKTAERMVIELQEKLTPEAGLMGTVTINTFNQEALDALLTLGFARHEAMRMLTRVPADILNTTEVVQYALKQK